MDEFPFNEADWSRINDLAIDIVNASAADDAPLCASLREEMRRVLHEMHDTYGRHPVLLDTEADYADEPSEQVALYQQARDIAVVEGLSSYLIRISLARVLLEQFNDTSRAWKELTACHQEVTTFGDEGDRREWDELAAKCRC